MSTVKYILSFIVCLIGFITITSLITAFKNDLTRMAPIFIAITFYFPVMVIVTFAYRIQR
jgi:hypothetical protein